MTQLYALPVSIDELEEEIVRLFVDPFEEGRAEMGLVFELHFVAADEETSECDLWEGELCLVGEAGIVGGVDVAEDKLGGLVILLHVCYTICYI